MLRLFQNYFLKCLLALLEDDAVFEGFRVKACFDVGYLFASALKNVQMQTKAKPGDKTMMDALVPAVEAIEACASEDIAEMLATGAAAAVAGAEATVAMKANFGRARNYGERSIGSMDSGAASWSCMFGAFAEAVK